MARVLLGGRWVEFGTAKRVGLYSKKNMTDTAARGMIGAGGDYMLITIILVALVALALIMIGYNLEVFIYHE